MNESFKMSLRMLAYGPENLYHLYTSLFQTFFSIAQLRFIYISELLRCQNHRYNAIGHISMTISS